jgi:hypothetical protein
MKHDKDFTHLALLAGLWVRLSMLEVMQTYTPDELFSLKNTARQFFGGELV